MMVRFTAQEKRIYCNGKLMAHAVSEAKAEAIVKALNMGMVFNKQLKADFDRPEYSGKYHVRTIPYVADYA